MKYENGDYFAAVSSSSNFTTITVGGKHDDKDQGFVWHRLDVSLSGADVMDILDYGFAEWEKRNAGAKDCDVCDCPTSDCIDDPALEDLYAWAQEVADKVIGGLLFGLQWHVDTIYKILFEDEEAS